MGRAAQWRLLQVGPSLLPINLVAGAAAAARRQQRTVIVELEARFAGQRARSG